MRIGQYPNDFTFEGYLSTNCALNWLFLLTKGLTFESTNGALLEHQKRIVNALAQLQSSNLAVFTKAYSHMEGCAYTFMRHEGYEHGAPREYYTDLLYQYAKKSGRFDETKLDRASRLLKDVKRQRVGFPPFEAVKRYFLNI
ncbi:hypothetical protein J4480_07005 [Candidatus Woesearchaeota archaeon]|nr:hypothetical protein [Candidatus Woesearchaeota archaeon]